MRIYNRYVVSLAITACAINTVLAFLGEDDIGVYFVVNAIAYLIITLLYAHLNPRAKRALNPVGAVLFGGFIVIAALKAVEFISGR